MMIFPYLSHVCGGNEVTAAPRFQNPASPSKLIRIHSQFVTRARLEQGRGSGAAPFNATRNLLPSCHPRSGTPDLDSHCPIRSLFPISLPRVILARISSPNCQRKNLPMFQTAPSLICIHYYLRVSLIGGNQTHNSPTSNFSVRCLPLCRLHFPSSLHVPRGISRPVTLPHHPFLSPQNNPLPGLLRSVIVPPAPKRS